MIPIRAGSATPPAGRLPPLPRAATAVSRHRDRPAFALAPLSSGHFTWKEWAGALADELRAAEDRGEPDDGTRYYEHWVTALERLVTAKGLTDSPALQDRKEAWADAYRHTPHGQPVVLQKTD